MGLRPLACWDCGFESRRGHGCLSVVSVVCCQVEISATGWSLVQRSPTDCGVSSCVISKTSKNEEAIARDWAVSAIKKTDYVVVANCILCFQGFVNSGYGVNGIAHVSTAVLVYGIGYVVVEGCRLMYSNWLQISVLFWSSRFNFRMRISDTTTFTRQKGWYSLMCMK